MNISELLRCRLQNNRLLLFESIRDNGSERRSEPRDDGSERGGDEKAYSHIPPYEPLKHFFKIYVNNFPRCHTPEADSLGAWRARVARRYLIYDCTATRSSPATGCSTSTPTPCSNFSRNFRINLNGTGSYIYSNNSLQDATKYFTERLNVGNAS